MDLPAISEFKVGSAKDTVLSVFSQYYRGKRSIAKQSIAVQAVMPFVTVSRDAKIALVKNSKSGCTSLARSIYTYDSGTDFAGNIHRSGAHLAQGYAHWQANYAHVKSSDTVVISALRNPTDRIVSAFFDFVVEQRNPLRLDYASVFKDFDLFEETSLAMRFDQFLDFVQGSMEIDPWKTDRHWRLQRDNLWADEITYDFILRTDMMETGYDTLRQALGLSATQFPLYHVNRSKTREFVPTPDQLARIEILYAPDFDLFESTTS